MSIEKLPSGSYRATVMVNGVRYRRTFNHKPTQKEVMQALAAEMSEDPKPEALTFEQAAVKYCESKESVLSPKTLREYLGMNKSLPEWFRMLEICNINQLAINRLVNSLASQKQAPKTIKNTHGFISAVLKTFRPDMVINTTLPQKRKEEPYIPSTEDIKKMLARLEGTEYEIPFILACYGMRRSEICALTVDDIEGNVVHINKALVQDSNNEWVLKITKTTKSTRDIVIPSEVADKIRSKGYVYIGHPNNISKVYGRMEKELGIPHFSPHKLRHYFASKMSAMGVPETDILALGGWETDNIMKSVYRHSMINGGGKEKISDKLSRELFN
jgi:integrase